MSKVGTLVKFKVDCLGNKAGTKGVVFYDYEDGYQAIFENGRYDGFSDSNDMPNGQTEIEYFLEEIGFSDYLSSYQFKSVIQVEQDFRNGFFDSIKKT